METFRRRYLESFQCRLKDSQLVRAAYGHLRQEQTPGAIGHKINFSSGKRRMILDTVIESGKPAGSSRLLPMIKRLGKVYGKPPNQVAADAGYTSIANIDAARALWIKAVVLPKNVAWRSKP